MIQSLFHTTFPFNFRGFLCANLPLLLLCIFIVVALLKRPRSPPTNNPAIDYQTADSEHVLKRSRPFGLSDEVSTETWPCPLHSYAAFLP